MAEMSAGTALRQLQATQAGMKKARKALLLARQSPDRDEIRLAALREGWDSLARAHKEMAAIPLAAASEDVMTRQLAVQRYATSMLVRLRRLARNEPGALEGLDEDDDLE
jgi:hypothetical protein